jgi:hypothetical protein
MIKFLRPGTWWVRSASDPRWNCTGISNAVGGFVIPQEAQAYLERKEKELGPPPKDAEWGYEKD